MSGGRHPSPQGAKLESTPPWLVSTRQFDFLGSCHLQSSVQNAWTVGVRIVGRGYSRASLWLVQIIEGGTGEAACHGVRRDFLAFGTLATRWPWGELEGRGEARGEAWGGKGGLKCLRAGVAEGEAPIIYGGRRRRKVSSSAGILPLIIHPIPTSPKNLVMGPYSGPHHESSGYAASSRRRERGLGGVNRHRETKKAWPWRAEAATASAARGPARAWSTRSRPYWGVGIR